MLGILDPLVQERIDADTEFQNSLVSLSDEERDKAIADKRTEVAEEVVAELKDKADKAEQHSTTAENQKKRAEKAEEELKKLKGDRKPDDSAPVLSPKDTAALIRADIHEDDWDDVVEYAGFKKISIGDALKSSVLQASLAEKQEHRETEQAKSHGTHRQGVKRLSDAELLDKYKSIAPEPGSDDAKRLFWLRRKKTR